VGRLASLLPALLNGPLVLLVALGLAAPYLHPGVFWWAAMAAVVLPITAALLALATLALLALRRTRWAILNGALLLFAAARLAPAGVLSTGEPPPPGDDELVVMTFSVPRYGESAEVLAQNVFDLLDAERPHMVALQETSAWRRRETPGTPRIADYVSPALDSLGFVLAIPARLAAARTRLPLLSHSGEGPVVIEQQEGSLAPGELSAEDSRYVRTRVRWQGRDVVVYNVHLRGYGTDKPWEEARFPLLGPRTLLAYVRRYRNAYRLRAREVRVLEERLEGEHLPVILAGDFNVTPSNWDYRVLARGRTDAFRAGGRGWGLTYRGNRPLVRIDYVVVDDAFEVVHAHVPDVTFSDHRPVVARLRWRAPAGDGAADSPAGRDF
jgi:endonuclease/exonuclease/phosphatase family metal-dependent hydrolase